MALRVDYVLERIHQLRHKQAMWKGKTLVVTGSVPDYRVYELVSNSIARIVGPGAVINETTISPRGQVEPSNQTVGSITVAVNTDYDDSDESIKQVQAIVQLPQFEVYSAAGAQTLSSVILDRYRLGVSDLPRTFAILLNRIQDLNNISNPNAIKGGPLKVPVLPPRVQSQVVNVTPHAGFGDYSVIQGQGHPICHIEIRGLPGVPILTCQHQVAALPLPAVRSVKLPTYILSLPVTSTDMLSTQSSLAAFPSQAQSAKITVNLAASSYLTSAVHKTLSSAEAALLASTLRKTPHRKATIFILDDGWPDPLAYSTSTAELQNFSDTVRDYFGMPHIDLRSAAFVASTDQALHSLSIRNSLREFTDADTSGLVKVVYVPLSKAQNSSPFLSELFRLYFMIRMATPATATSEPLTKAADSWVSEVLANIQDKYNDQKIPTDWAIIESVWSIADFTAFRSSGRDVFFINESWTVDPGPVPGAFNESHSGVSAGVVVAAVGNTLGKVVNSDAEGLDFARQCTSTRSVIAALNVQANQGIVCNSSIVNADLLNDTFVAAYDGEVQGGPNEHNCLTGKDLSQCVCGSSFSAPRIAWMLALSEALRADDLDYTSWNVALENKLRRLRTQDSIPWAGEYLHFSELMK